MKITLNKDRNLTEKVIDGLNAKKLQYGTRYCLSVMPILHDEDHICICNDFIYNTKAGEYCRCGLYKKIEE